ncbi:MAG: helix-turn-helix transcriptional regulator [Halieaceae bacterium]
MRSHLCEVFPLSQAELASAQWQGLLANMINSLAQEEFYENFSRGCEYLSGYDSALIVWLSSEHRPVHLYDDVPEAFSKQTLPPWFEGAYLLDPFYQLFVDNAPDGVYPLADIAPDFFFETEYAHNFYANTGLKDECGLLVNLDKDHAILVSLGRRDEGEVSAADIETLKLTLPVLATLCRKQQSAGEGEITFSAPLNKAFRNFGRDHLSKRECEVIQLILKGHSNKGIAQLLDISVDTVKVFNKRFHTKLNISSQAELFSLFFEAISLVPFDADIDPLTHYLEITQRR